MIDRSGFKKHSVCQGHGWYSDKYVLSEHINMDGKDIDGVSLRVQIVLLDAYSKIKDFENEFNLTNKEIDTMIDWLNRLKA